MKPLRGLLGILWIAYKVIAAFLIFMLTLAWHLSIHEAKKEAKSCFDYFYEYTAFNGKFVIGRFNTYIDFVNWNYVRIFKSRETLNQQPNE